jgi:hypothetical protein
MQIHRHTFFASIFIVLFIATGVSYAQTATTSNGNSATVHGSASASTTGTSTVVAGTATNNGVASVSGAESSEDWSSMDMESSQFAQNHPHIAKALKFLNDESYRAGIEAKMTNEDKQAIEAAVVDAKSNIETLKGLRPQYKAARATHDSLTLYQMEKTSRPNFDQLVIDRRTIIDIIAKYKFAPPATTTGSLLDPVYPNPVHLGGSPATISYHTQQSGPVKIVVTDASGSIVQDLSNESETLGDHTVSLNTKLPGAGTYYVTVESNGVKSTQKVEVVQ